MQWLINIILALCKTYTDEQIALQAHVPTGTICLWYGTFADVPDGWWNCDGTHGTPDLRSKFLRAAGSGIPDHQVGGALTHGHSLTNLHYHQLGPGPDISAGAVINRSSTTPNNQDSAIAESNLPPYHALRAIMKL